MVVRSRGFPEGTRFEGSIGAALLNRSVNRIVNRMAAFPYIRRSIPRVGVNKKGYQLVA